MIATAGSPIFFLNSRRNNRIHGVCDSQIYLYKSFGEDIKNTVRISVPCSLYNSYLSIGEITGFPSLSSRGVMPPA